MNEQKLRQKIRNIGGDVLGLSNALYTLESLNFKMYPHNFAEHSLNTAIKAEKIACRMRNLIGDCGIIRREYLMEQVADAHQIDMCRFGEGIFISLPRLLPKIIQPKSSKFINQPLYHALSNYHEDVDFEKFHQCSICFVHLYDKELSLGRVRDYDNIETRDVLNTISAFFMTDDGGQWCDVHHTTMLGDYDCTHIYIMPQESFPDFFFKLKNE